MAQRDFTAEFGMGSGVGPLAMITRSSDRKAGGLVVCSKEDGGVRVHAVPRGSETDQKQQAAQGCPLRSDSGRIEIKPIERLGPVGSTHCCAFTPGLSTWWSSTALGRDLVLRGVSRLDAFSGYPVRT